MCGIAGFVAQERLPDGSAQLLRRMCDRISHRGPDDHGYHVAPHVALGARRLSIIDLQTGHQPVTNQDGSVVVVFNGEIYNYRELRQELLQKGHRLTTVGDTETIAHLYDEYGDDCVKRLRGMFAFALWDEKRRRLLLARDRVGIKPMFYTQTGGQLVFGSEIKCLLELPDFRRRLDPRSLLLFLSFLYVPAPGTIYQGISELPPAHYLVWENGHVRLSRYWSLAYRPDSGHPESYYVEGMRAKLTDAVRSHLVSDVPLGAFLSGGIDSGAVVALMSQAQPDAPAETFTVGFEGNYAFFDERQDARRVADRYRTHHHEFVVRPDVADVLPSIVSAFDQPLADSSAIPNYYICQLARTRVTVALSGLGGDELAGGYERYLGVVLGQRYQKLPASLRNLLAHAAQALPDWGGNGRFTAERLKRFLRSAQGDPATAYLQLLSTFDRAQLEQLLAGEYREQLAHHAPEEFVLEGFRRSQSQDPVNQMLSADTLGYLPGDLLQLTDRMSMAHSLEVRVPYLDHELLEFAASIPSDVKIRGLNKKYVLKKVAASLLPRETIHGRKRGFSVPLAFWFRGQLRPLVERQLSPARLERLGCFQPGQVAVLLDEHFSSRANHEGRIWALLIFSLWHDLYLENESLPRLADPGGLGLPKTSATGIGRLDA